MSSNPGPFTCGNCRGDGEIHGGHKPMSCTPCRGSGRLRIRVRQRYDNFFAGHPHYEVFDPKWPTDKLITVSAPGYEEPTPADIITKILRREPLIPQAGGI